MDDEKEKPISPLLLAIQEVMQSSFDHGMAFQRFKDAQIELQVAGEDVAKNYAEVRSMLDVPPKKELN